MVKNLENLWPQLVKIKFRFTCPLSLPLNLCNYSFVWKGILDVWPLLVAGLCGLPNNGEDVLIRRMPWIPNGTSFYLEWREGRAEAALVRLLVTW